MRVFVVQHQHERHGCDEVKFIGVYSTARRGRAAIARAKRLPGFRNHPRGFSVDPYVVDMTHWDEGFKTVWLGRGRPSSARRPSNKPLERTGRARRSAPIR